MDKSHALLATIVAAVTGLVGAKVVTAMVMFNAM